MDSTRTDQKDSQEYVHVAFKISLHYNKHRFRTIHSLEETVPDDPSFYRMTSSHSGFLRKGRQFMGIVVFGAVFVDIKGYPLGPYIPGGRNAGQVIQVHGGVSRNVAEDIANVELKPTFVSLVDESGIGSDVIAKLRRHNVNTDYIRRTPDGLGTWLAIFDNDGDVVAAISKRPVLDEIENILIDHGDEIIQNADSVVVEIDMEQDLLDRIFGLAEKYEKDIFAVVSNMSIAMERREMLKKTACVVCNLQEAGLLFSENYDNVTVEELRKIIQYNAIQAKIPRIVVTLGDAGSVYTQIGGESGFCPPIRVNVADTVGAGDAFFSGVTIGLTYGKTLGEACEIGTRLASSTIATKNNVCPRYLPEEFGLILPR